MIFTLPPILQLVIQMWKRSKRGVCGMVKNKIAFDGEGN
jgi:hypothetical protein